MNRAQSVSAIIPARNEEDTIARAVRSLAAQPEISEIIVVNDQSTDGTAAELARLRLEIPHLRVLETQGLPAGWVGKNYAVSLGAAKRHPRGCFSPTLTPSICQVPQPRRSPTRRRLAPLSSPIRPNN